MKRHQKSLQTQLLDGDRPWKLWNRRIRTANATHENKHDLVEVDYSIFNPKDYLLSWSTIVAGVETDDGHQIVPEHNDWVNDNGNAWLNQVLLESYKSFIWSENYLEHIQIPQLSKGKILDAVAWVMREGQTPTVFIDILVATNKKRHPKLVESIRNGTISTMSMGCEVSHFQCSRCGETFEDGVDDPCTHLEQSITEKYTDAKGKKRITAELCGVPGKPGSCLFTESSWVAVPAFNPAIRHGGLQVGQQSTHHPLKSLVPKDRISQAAPE